MPPVELIAKRTHSAKRFVDRLLIAGIACVVTMAFAAPSLTASTADGAHSHPALEARIAALEAAILASPTPTPTPTPASSSLKSRIAQNQAVKVAYVGNSIGLAYPAHISNPANVPATMFREWLRTRSVASNVINYSHGGAMLAHADAGYSHLAAGTIDTAFTAGCDSVMLACTVNEALTDGITTTIYQNDLEVAIAHVREHNMEPILVAENYIEELPGYPGHDYESYITIVRTVAAAQSVELIDFYTPTEKLVTSAGGAAASGIFDSADATKVHMNDAGSRLLGDTLIAWANPAQGGGASMSQLTISLLTVQINDQAPTNNYINTDPTVGDGSSSTSQKIRILIMPDTSDPDWTTFVNAVNGGATTSNGNVRLYCNFRRRSNAISSPQSVSLYRLKAAFIQGEATWNNRVTGTAWTTAGASSTTSDREAAASAAVNLSANTAADSPNTYTGYQWSAAQVGTDAAWMAANSSAYGWVLICPAEACGASDYFFHTFNDDSQASNKPELVIDYTPADVTAKPYYYRSCQRGGATCGLM